MKEVIKLERDVGEKEVLLDVLNKEIVSTKEELISLEEKNRKLEDKTANVNEN